MLGDFLVLSLMSLRGIQREFHPVIQPAGQRLHVSGSDSPLPAQPQAHQLMARSRKGNCRHLSRTQASKSQGSQGFHHHGKQPDHLHRRGEKSPSMDERRKRITMTHEHQEPNSLPRMKCLGNKSLQCVLLEKEWQQCGCNKNTCCGSLWIKKKKKGILIYGIKYKNMACQSTEVVTRKRQISMLKNLQLFWNLDFFL